MSYNHITIDERACIRKLMSEVTSIRKIALYLDRSASTNSREIKWNKGSKGVYYTTRANQQYKVRRLNCGRPIRFNFKVMEYINLKIEKKWSLEQIYERSKIEQIENIPSFSTIYRWIHLGLIVEGDMKKLRRKGKFKRPQEKRGRFNIGKTIKERIKHVFNRKEIRHWEADTVESGRDGHARKSLYVLVTLVERKSIYTLSMKLQNRKEEFVSAVIISMLYLLPLDLVKSTTCDREKEFAGFENIEEKHQCASYFADYTVLGSEGQMRIRMVY